MAGRAWCVCVSMCARVAHVNGFLMDLLHARYESEAHLPQNTDDGRRHVRIIF